MRKANYKELFIKYHKTIVAAILILSVLYVKKSVFVNVAKVEYKDNDAEKIEYDLAECDIKQTFVAREEITAFYLRLYNKNDGEKNAKVSIYDAKTDELLSEQVAVIPVTTDESALVGFNMSTSGVKQGQELYFKVTGEKNTYLLASRGDYGEELTVTNEKQQARVLFMVWYLSTRDWLSFALAVIMALLSVWVLMYPEKERVPLYKIVGVFALIAGITFAYVNPLGQECDGWEHTLRSIDVSNGNILAPIANLTHSDGVILVPENVDNVQFELVNTYNGVVYVDNLKHMYFSSKLVEREYESTFFSLFYWPQGLGFALGKILGLSVFASLFLARILNLIVYIWFVSYAIKITPVFKNLFAVVSLLPMTVYQSASCSPDAILVGLCMLFVAKCFYLAYGECDNLGIKEVFPLTIMPAIIFLCKYVYVLLGLLVLLIPISKFESKKKYFKTFIVCILPLIVVAFGMMNILTNSVGLLAGSGNDGLSQTDFVLHNPFEYTKIMINTIVGQFSEYVIRLNYLGWLRYSLKFLIVIIPGFLLGVAILDTNEKTSQIKTIHKWIGLFTFGAIFAATLTGLYLGDGRINPYGSGVIQGFQGRYFIPIMVPGLMIFSSCNVKNDIKNFSYKVTGWMGVFLFLTVIWLRMNCY